MQRMTKCLEIKLTIFAGDPIHCIRPVLCVCFSTIGFQVLARRWSLLSSSIVEQVPGVTLKSREWTERPLFQNNIKSPLDELFDIPHYTHSYTNAHVYIMHTNFQSRSAPLFSFISDTVATNTFCIRNWYVVTVLVQNIVLILVPQNDLGRSISE